MFRPSSVLHCYILYYIPNKDMYDFQTKTLYIILYIVMEWETK